MGCFCSKNVRCLRCNENCDDEQFRNNTRVCIQCIQDENKLREYQRRLAALRDDTLTTTAVQPQRILIANVPRLNTTAQPSYIAKRKLNNTKPQIRKTNTARPANTKALYGKYRCVCGRSWKSYRSWPRMYQICQGCREHVYPSLQRELLESERLRAHVREGPEHPEHLCEKCIRLGRNCNRR